MDEPAPPICVLLLDGALEQTAFARRAEDLLRAPGVIAVEPGRRPARLLAGRIAQRLAKRLPGTPRLVLAFHGAHRPLAAALAARSEAELLLAGRDFDAGDDGATPAFALNAPLWDRLEALEIARR